jgi:glutathione peroxidase
MKLLIMSCLGVLSVFFQQHTSIYSIICTKADGTTLQLRNYKGKKTLFVLLPLADDTTFYRELAVFQQKYQDSINIIGIPVAEIGFDSEKVRAITTSIVKSNTVVLDVVITDTVAGKPAPLMEWLTQKEKNDHFQVNKVVGGQKYFVDERGTLYAVMGPKVPFTAPVMDRIVQRAQPVSKPMAPAH